MTRNPNAPHPDGEGYELCPRCGARLRYDHTPAKGWVENGLHCLDCELEDAAEREMEEEGRMHP